MRQISTDRLVEEVARRTGLDEETVRAVIAAVADTVGGTVAITGWADITELASFAGGEGGEGGESGEGGAQDGEEPGAGMGTSGRRVLVSVAEALERPGTVGPSARGAGVLIARDDDPWAAETASLMEGVGYKLATAATFEEALAVSGKDPGDLAFVMIGPSIDDATYADLAHSLKLEPRTMALPIVLGRPAIESLVNPGTVQIMPDGAFDSPAGAARLVSAEVPRWRDERALLSRRVTLRSPSDAPSVRSLRDMLEAFYKDAFEDRTEGYKTLSAFREAIDNAAHHGNDYSPSRYLTVTLVRDAEGLALDVKDEGSGFDYEQALQACRTGDAAESVRERIDRGEHGGLGMKLMVECTDEVRFSDHGTRVTLVKRRA